MTLELQQTAQEAFAQEDKQARDLVRDLHKVRPSIYWTDLLLSCAAGWSGFAWACFQSAVNVPMVLGVAIAVIGLYRALCFIHEMSHFSPKTLPGFGAVWNLLVGYPLLMPSFVYCGVHQYHHKLSTYGTSQDPEYRQFASSRLMTSVFAAESFLIPLFLGIRFLILSPVALLIPSFQRWLLVHASSLTMNLAYRREVSEQLLRSIRLHSAAVLGLWLIPISLLATGRLQPRVLVLWLVVSSLISFVNTLRTLGAHDYESDGNPLDRPGQLLDSIDTPGAAWWGIWAPVGLRYHALHHYFPGLPYHNLRKAHALLTANLPRSATYRQTQSPSLWHSLRTLYRHGR